MHPLGRVLSTIWAFEDITSGAELRVADTKLDLDTCLVWIGLELICLLHLILV